MKNELPIMAIRAMYSELAAKVDSGEATEGKVLTANGEGGSSWQDPQGGLDPSEIPSGEIVDDGIVGINADNELVKGSLFGKFVRIMDAPASTTLTDEQLSIIEEGVFIKGDFLEMHNPVLYPFGSYGGYKCGIAIGQRLTGYGTGFEFAFRVYLISETTKVIGAQYNPISISTYNKEMALNADNIRLNGINVFLKGKNYPSYPATTTDKKFHFVLDNGTLTWQEGNGLYKHTIVFNTDYEIQLISNDATPVDSLSGLATLLKDAKTTQILYVDHTNDECVFAPYGHSGNDASYDDQANEISVDITRPIYDAVASTKCSFNYIGLVISAPDGVTITDTVTAL